MNQNVITQNNTNLLIITAGSTYLDIDAYACSVAMAELLQLKGIPAIAYSTAPCNYSVCESLIQKGQLLTSLPTEFQAETAKYIVVDVSDPEYMKENVPINQVVEIYDHHVGFEAYWTSCIGEQAHIEFIGAAATLIYREWKKASLQDQMTRSTALLLIAAILDNTLNLTSSNTTAEDRIAFHELCQKANVDHKWCATYFSQVQEKVEADLKNALFNDIKTLRGNVILPPRIAQLCVWDARGILARLPEIRRWFADKEDSWMINIIDIRQHCSYFVCDDHDYQKEMEKIFHIQFESGVAKSQVSYLRKEIIKKTLSNL